jgi:TolB-like protein/Tfp pilus assembly protein PilF
MAIWSAEIKELEKLYESLIGNFPELEKELGQLIKTEDANVVMLYSRRCLEVIITDLCECELKRPRKTEPLKGIIDKLQKEGKVPSNIITSMHGLNELSTFGTHPKDFDPEQVKPVLNNLSTIIKWFFKYKESRTNVKTKAAEETRQEIKNTENVKKDITISRKRLAGILGVSIGIIASVFAFLYFSDIIGGSKQIKELEKSIAVLPFKNDSPDSENQHIINGTMEAILDNLCKVANLKVLSRTSVEQYRSTTKSVPEIAKELNVSYILEGSGQKYGDEIRLTVQLIDAINDKHIWSSPYDRNIKEIFKIQSEIAQAVASEIKAIITADEKELIEKIPTANMTAYDLYLKANEYQKEYGKTHDLSSYQTAVNLYRASLKMDTTFAKAYTGLARAYYDRYYWPGFFKENFLDSCLILANIALSIDDKLDEAYYIKGQYYRQNGNIEEALNNYDKTLRINPSFYSAYAAKGNLYANVLSDNVKGLENYHKALTLVSGDERPSLLRDLGNTYSDLGFTEKAKYYYQEAFAIDGSQTQYLSRLAWLEFNLENYEESLKLFRKVNEIDTTWLFNLHFYLYPTGYDDEAFAHAKKIIERNKRTGVPIYFQSHRIGYIFYKMGKLKEANDYFNQQIKYSEESIKLNRFYSQLKHAHYDMAATYAFLGNKEKAYQNLDEFNTMDFFDLMLISFVENDPMFASIRSEERFQKIVQDMKAKNLAEHDRVMKWLVEQGMI